MRPGRPRAGLSQSADERARGDAGRRQSRRARTRVSRLGRRFRHRYGKRHRAGAPASGAGTVLYHQGSWKRSWVVDLPLHSVGDRRQADDRQPPGSRYPGRDRSAARDDSPARDRMNPARILVVDDEPGMLRAVERILSGAHHVVTSRSSVEAIALAGRFDPELAILDVRMPELDGFELMARLHAEKADLDV